MPAVSETPPVQLHVGVDIAYQTFTAAWLRPRAPKAERLGSFPQTSAGFTRFAARLRESDVAPAAMIVVMEATGTYGLALAASLHQSGFPVAIVNPAKAHAFARSQRTQAKTDTIDAATLAFYSQAVPFPLWTPPPAIYDELMQRLSQRDNLLNLLNQVHNQLHALRVCPTVIESVREQMVQTISHLKTQLKQMEKEIKGLVTQDSAWKESLGRVLSIPGIGLYTACLLIATTRNFTLCPSADALSCYVGLAPLENTSGSSVHKGAHIGARGKMRLRRMLYMATLSAIHYNPAIKTFFTRLRAAGKPMKVARCACARKLLQIAYAVATKEAQFDPTYGLDAQIRATSVA